VSLCRSFLTAARAVARQHGEPTDIGFGVLDNSSRGSHRYFVVEAPDGRIVWEGGACCRYCARAEAILAMSPSSGEAERQAVAP
jgi:hypothetical protein